MDFKNQINLFSLQDQTTVTSGDERRSAAAVLHPHSPRARAIGANQSVNQQADTLQAPLISSSPDHDAPPTANVDVDVDSFSKPVESELSTAR